MRALISRFLDPLDAAVELIYGVLIVMTFTMAVGALDLATLPEYSAKTEFQRLLLAAFGCAVAWGFIDAVVYLLICAAEHSRDAATLQEVRAATSAQDRMEIVAEALGDSLGALADEEDHDQIYSVLAANLAEADPVEHWIESDDIRGAIAIFVIACLATIPVVIPLLFGRDPFWSMRIANGLSIAVLFATGYWWARQTNLKAVRTGLLVASLGVFVTLVAIPMGG